ncbi:glycosyltransferase [Frankia sp. CiP3]|uniref:glycosyltransferase n=1 Tax=Frankia sp. CiP3 TaxID=2880971 RepID=UPI001EF65F59|nr:glycosyltransferase [Frankia sp. CiP3]
MNARWLPAPPPVVDPEQIPASPPPVRIKVLHIITRFEAGAGANTLLSAIGMDRHRYEVWIAGPETSPLWERAERAGIRTVRIPQLHREMALAADLLVLVRLVRLIRRERFGIVHTHSAKGAFLGRLAARLCRSPVVIYTLHGREPWWPPPDGSHSRPREVMPAALQISGFLQTFSFLERALRSATHGFIAVSPSVARDSVLARIATPGRVEVVPSAVDLDDIPHDTDQTVRADLRIPDGFPVVGTVTRLDPQKAPLDFVRMAALVAARRPGVRFVMVGDGEQAAEARTLASRLRVDILFTGFRSDAARIASAFDVFVVSSLYEGVGRSVTEAMASGRAVVATAVDGVVDLVTPGATGILARPRNPETLAECVCWLLDHPMEAERMGTQARTYVRELFTRHRMCTTLDETYSRLLGFESVPLDQPRHSREPRQRHLPMAELVSTTVPPERKRHSMWRPE